VRAGRRQMRRASEPPGDSTVRRGAAHSGGLQRGRDARLVVEGNTPELRAMGEGRPAPHAQEVVTGYSADSTTWKPPS
jgi:hypothetical protein